MSRSRFTEQKNHLMERLFPEGLPMLWCPLLTHYTPRRTLDKNRIQAHLSHLSEQVEAYLISGTTGDGWELTDAENKELFELILGCAKKLQLRVLVGALKANASLAAKSIQANLQVLEKRFGSPDAAENMVKAGLCGFTVCAPKGSGLGQEEIKAGLKEILKLGAPTAVYQLPLMTGNEILPDVVAGLSEEHPNFYLFKDSSGGDAVALSGVHSVLLLRGVEGDYAKYLSLNKGPYDGLFVSTLNCLANELNKMMEHLRKARIEDAEKLSSRITEAVRAVFKIVEKLPQGNAYTNANKAMDHFFAFGPKAVSVPPPRLHSGIPLPVEVIKATAAVLTQYNLMPNRGYLR